MKLAVLASQNGTNAQAIVEAVRCGALDAQVAVILTNREDAGVIKRGRLLGVPVEIIPSKGYKKREEYDSVVVEALKKYDVDTIALAGWMRILSEVFLNAFDGHIVNLHPAVLPSFTGGTAIQDAYGYGVKIAGCSVLLVSPVLDGGPLIIQAAVPVPDTQAELEEKIHGMEHLIFPQALQWIPGCRSDGFPENGAGDQMTATHCAYTDISCYFISLIAAWAAARRAMGTRKGEQLT